MFRLRYDAAYGNNVPDRAEYFYPKCGCFRVLGLDPEAEGPPEIETNVDYQDIRPYFEYAANDNFSVFVEMALRSLNPEQNDNTTGFGDMNTGFKYALLADPDEYFTFQFRAYVPTGDGDRGLGTEHVSLEPGLLYFNRLTSRTILQAELQYWIPLGGSDFAGDIIRYGVGLGYTVHESCDMTVTPIAEFVGWSILDGQEFNGNTGMVSDSGGTTIVNGKFGVRIGLGNDGGQSALGRNNSVYIGYGRALTNEVWYEDILRLEYRLLY